MMVSPSCALVRALAKAGPSTGLKVARSWRGSRVGRVSCGGLGLFLSVIWLLWGELVWTIMENIFPNSMPLQLDRLGVPKEWIGYTMGTAGAVINMSFVPVVSFRSDRTRTR